MIDPNRLCLGCMNELEEENKTCKICGWNNEADENNPHQLKCGAVLQGKYLVGKVLGEGGFGITYLGWNLILQEKVAIKEFYPHGYVGRDTTVNATVLSYVGQESFTEKSKDGFIREAKTMQSLNKVEGIVEMKDVFAENNTVYIVMEYVEGKTLKEYVKENGNKLPMSTVLKLLKPVMDALEQIHAHNLIHRDISPDNIMVSPDGRVTLLDLGAARQISADGGHSLTVNVKHGYAPMEQYQTHGEQGPWTDIYALCATIYRLITGKVPPSAADRAFDDSMVRPMMLGADITEEQEKILLKGLAPRSGDRYLNMFELRNAFKPTEKEDIIEEIIVSEEIISIENENKVQKDINIKDEIKPKSKSNNEKIIKIAIAVATFFLIVGISFFSADVIEKNKIEKEYNSAVLLVENGKYEEAMAAFEALGDYKDSAEQIVICEDGILEIKYQEAVSLIEEEKYEDAKISFEKLGDYKDSKEQILKCEDALAWVKLQEAVEKGNAITDSSIKVGDYITFGCYEQDNNFENGAEPIEWQVLDVQDGKVLVISKYALDCQRYNNTSASVTWKTCSLRKWLNSTFINTAFNEEEQQKIIYTIISNQNAESEVGNENYTEDKIFLLSIEETKQYFPSNEERKCKSSDYIKKYFDSNGNCYWWLRSQGNNKKLAHHISYDGDFTISSVNIDIIDVRPTMWVDIDYFGDDKENKDVTAVNVLINKNINIKLDTVLGAKSFSKSGNVPDGIKLTGEWVLNDNDEYVFTMSLKGNAETEGEYLFLVNYLDETGKIVETKEYLIYAEKTVEQENKEEKSVSSDEIVSDKLSYLQGTWINEIQDVSFRGYKLVIEGNKFVIYDKREKIVIDSNFNEIAGTIEYEKSGTHGEKSDYFPGYKYYRYNLIWNEEDTWFSGAIELSFNPVTNKPETMLLVYGNNILGEYILT